MDLLSRRGIAALLGLLLLAACNGPSLPLARKPVTVARHDAELFPTAHGQAENPAHDCNACHGGFDSFAQYDCLGCHAHAETATEDAHAGVAGYRYESGACRSCHPTGVTAATGIDHFPVQAGAAHGEVKCLACHTQSDDYATFTCTDCHAHAPGQTNAAHAAVTGYAFATPDCYRCHPDGRNYPAQHADFYPIADGAHASYACAACHPQPASLTAYTCTQCHDGSHACANEGARHTAVSGFSCSETACVACHRSGEPSGG